jgi:hypothetical protein
MHRGRWAPESSETVNWGLCWMSRSGQQAGGVVRGHWCRESWLLSCLPERPGDV